MSTASSRRRKTWRTKTEQQRKKENRISQKRKRRVSRDQMEQALMQEQKRLLQQNREKLSVIISASNEEETIGLLLANIKELLPKEIIVVENGSTDDTHDICLQHGTKLISYPYQIGHDVGRAVGAKAATGDILLFLDGDIILTAKELWPFIWACYNGVDIALNNINRFYTSTTMIDAVSMAKAFLNRLLLHPQLKYSSLTAVPHAMKREAAEAIGYEHLSCPPKAQAIAALKGLTIRQVNGADVIRKNKIRPYNSQQNNHVEALILGDHIEAIQLTQKWIGERVFFTDTIRQREQLKLLKISSVPTQEIPRK